MTFLSLRSPGDSYSLIFATIFSALGLDPYAQYDQKDIATFFRVEEKAAPIKEVLA